MLNSFLKNNEVRIGEDFQSGQPNYYESLLASYRHYFDSFQTRKTTRHFHLEFENNSRKGLAFNYSDLYNTKFCISAIHNFFELLIRGLISGCISEKELKNMNFVQKQGELNKQIYLGEIEESYKFLTTRSIRKNLLVLNDLRNDFIHDATLSINLHGLDYLMARVVTPIVLEVIQTDMKLGVIKFFPIYFSTHYQINILEKISELQFEVEDFESKDNSGELAYELIKLGHLKEMGRACINNTLRLRGDRSVSWYENRYDNPHLRNEKFAALERDNADFYSLHHCPCCGVKSQVVYRKSIKDIFDTGKDFVSWSICYTCFFSLNDDNGDPYYSGLIPGPIFPW